ncbi:MAG TPA: GlsB/YeaQ/YmgE family stress response membrane protein [Roseiarcus sp.]|nr:GlsB/YeaQ/YmgE family stress response membrane protein [Roseiarcus sp.]
MLSFIIWLIVGGIAGWLAGQLVKGAGFGVIGNVALGIVGSVVAGFILPKLGIFIGGNFIADIVDAAIGAIIVLAIVAFIRRS